MDPLSVTASIVGLLGAAGKITSLLYGVTTKVSNAPNLAKSVLTEVADVTTALEQLQTYVIGAADVPSSRSSLIMLEQLLVTLSGCVATFSELESLLDNLDLVSELRKLARVKWGLKESRIVAILQRLQNHKASLILMLTILQWYARCIHCSKYQCRY